jgi:hypothetical protein
VAADVCAVLGISNNRDAMSRLDEDEKGVGSTDTLGVVQQLATVNESGLYSLILASRKTEAKRFKKWVTSDVLPSIRKTAHYAVLAQPLVQSGAAVVTMTSLELVDFINSQRGPGEAELRHDHFMAKVPRVIGGAAPKFLGTGFYTNGTGAKVERRCYRFPKREACLMAMNGLR